jgi:hypothetical protein
MASRAATRSAGQSTTGCVPDGRTGVPPRETTAGDARSSGEPHNDRETFAQVRGRLR